MRFLDEYMLLFAIPHVLRHALKNRSLLFFLNTNLLEEKRRLWESKSSLQRFIPPAYTPHTKLFPAQTKAAQVLGYLSKHLQYPVVLKPMWESKAIR